jgi:phosphotriesterase-related protein
MKRREILKLSMTLTTWPLGRLTSCADDAKAPPPRVMTVKGEVSADQLGQMLPHEHILVDFVGADKVSPDRYDADEAYRIMLPYVKQAATRLPNARPRS